MTVQPSVGDRIDITIERIVPRGLGIAFAEGLTIFVPLAAAGDRVRVEITQRKKNIAFARIAEVLEASADRITPPCKYFGGCGGCDLQQMNYPAQLRAKSSMVADSLRRLGKIEIAEVETVASPQEFGYRGRARWQVRGGIVGYFRRESHDVIDVEHCPILTPKLNEGLDAVRKAAEGGLGVQEVEAAADAAKFVVSSPERDEEMLAVQAVGFEYRFRPTSFFQANAGLVEPLVNFATEGFRGAKAADLYCGVGLFTLPLARNFTEVTGVEAVGDSIELARANAETNGISNVTFVRGSVRGFVETSKAKDADLFLLDPPRSGTEKGVIEKIAALRPKAISYVSCDPAILGRDLRVLMDAGYRLDGVKAFDLFPQSHHVETVARLSRK
ncbi:MAG: 23S rRNA (uracil-5-)-methyltransferase RumA [Acidobacteria bacterium OLB17]|nr:MAG: 23S rRNA (uracil-5-)-methyltransferase RumA [Acidobacteria bacterium OLB17]MCZ2389942.1 class I SAM-dependent RNA methyltransferase [Acidobacteriota bacterium]